MILASMPVCWQFPEPVERSGRSVRHQSLLSGALPSRSPRRQLEPGDAELEVFWRRCAEEQVHAVRHTFEY
jgi:hypothetical protein